MQIKIHSMTDLITNSSTVIFTYSDASPKALEAMVDEIFRVSGVDKRCSDVFGMVVMFEDEDEYLGQVFEKGPPEPYDTEDNFEQLITDICAGKVEKPNWLSKLEKGCENGCDYPCSTTLHVFAKSPEYEPLAELVTKYLYSTNHEATRDG